MRPASGGHGSARPGVHNVAGTANRHLPRAGRRPRQSVVFGRLWHRAVLRRALLRGIRRGGIRAGAAPRHGGCAVWQQRRRVLGRARHRSGARRPGGPGRHAGRSHRGGRRRHQGRDAEGPVRQRDWDYREPPLQGRLRNRSVRTVNLQSSTFQSALKPPSDRLWSRGGRADSWRERRRRPARPRRPAA